MHALDKPVLPLALAMALALCVACSGSGAEDESSNRRTSVDSRALSQAGAPSEPAAPLPPTEEELRRVLDALEQELGHQK